jgi:hypothetical protein
VLFIRHSGPRLYPLTKSVGHQTSYMSCPSTYDAHKNIRWSKRGGASCGFASRIALTRSRSSQQPAASSQEPRAKSQEPSAKCKCKLCKCSSSSASASASASCVQVPKKQHLYVEPKRALSGLGCPLPLRVPELARARPSPARGAPSGCCWLLVPGGDCPCH